MAKKITKKENFETIMGIVREAAEVTEDKRNELLIFLNHEIELLDGKAEAVRKKKAEKTDGLLELVVSVLETVDSALQIKELLVIPEISNYRDTSGNPVSAPKLTAIMTKLKKEEIVVREEQKKTVYFHLASRSELSIFAEENGEK